MRNKTRCIALIIPFFTGLVGCQSSSFPVTTTSPTPMTPLPQAGMLDIYATPDEQSLFGTEIVIDTLDLGTTFTYDNPATDNEQISLILEELLSHFLSQFSQAGWYHFPTDGREGFWVHLPVAGTDTFDQFLWTRQYSTYAPGFVWPASIVLADGTWGSSQLSYERNDYYFEKGGKPERPTELAELDYFAGNTWGFFGHKHLMRYIHFVQNPDQPLDSVSDVSRTFSGWVEVYEGQAAFVLLTRQTYHGVKPQLYDTRATINRDDIFSYFSLQNGGCIAEKYIHVLEDGNAEEDALHFNQHLIEYYPVLPEKVQTIYDQAATRLREFLASQ